MDKQVRALMTHQPDHSDLDDTAALLVGHSISRVRYLGWWQNEPEEPGAYVEYVELTMDDGAALRVSTDPDEFGSYGISVYEGPYPEPADAIHILDASGRRGWALLLGSVVATSSIGWAEVEAARVSVTESTESPPGKPVVTIGTERVIVPCELNLTFVGGASAILTAAAWSNDGTLTTESDNVAVCSASGTRSASRSGGGGLGGWTNQSADTG